MSTPVEIGAGERAWMTSTRESGWHAVRVSAHGGSVVAVCGHRLSGPVHRRFGDQPPQDAARMVCAPCTRLAGVRPPRVPRVSPRIGWHVPSPEIEWPTEDPDEDSGTEATERLAVFDSALLVLLDRRSEPGSSSLPKPARPEPGDDLMSPAA